MTYQQLRQHLRTPRRIIIDPWQRLPRNCNPPEDPNWPTPTTQEEIEELMRRLPHWAQVACALTAAEMVLPIWEENEETEWVNENLTEEQFEAPSRAIEITWQSLDGDVPDNEAVAANKTAAANAGDVAMIASAAARGAARTARAARAARAATNAAIGARLARLARAALATSWAASNNPGTNMNPDVIATVAVVRAAMAARPARDIEAAEVARVARAFLVSTRATTEAVRAAEAAETAEAAEASDIEFYHNWWDLCRCRLAFILEARPF